MDGKDLITKTGEILISDDVIKSIVNVDSNDNVAIFTGYFSPIRAAYPQITLKWDAGKSEEIIPAEVGHMFINAWLEKEEKEPYKTLQTIENRVLQLLNRNYNSITDKSSPFDEIDRDPAVNKGLRIVQFLKVNAEKDYDKEIEKHYLTMDFNVVMSEDEDFTKDFGGPWVFKLP